jgi:hypothetical protein
MGDFVSAADILQTVREVYLNDPQITQYTDTKILPYLKEAYGFLATDLEKNNIQCGHAISEPLLVKAGATTFSEIPGNFMWPVALEERLAGSTDVFIPMIQRRWPPQVLQTDKLVYWTWNAEEFSLLGATTDREVLIYYHKKFPALVDVNSYVLGKAEQYLTAKTAALVHLFLAQNTTLAQQCDALAESNQQEIINIFTKLQQSMPVRRKPYIPFR